MLKVNFFSVKLQLNTSLENSVKNILLDLFQCTNNQTIHASVYKVMYNQNFTLYKVSHHFSCHAMYSHNMWQQQQRCVTSAERLHLRTQDFRVKVLEPGF